MILVLAQGMVTDLALALVQAAGVAAGVVEEQVWGLAKAHDLAVEALALLAAQEVVRQVPCAPQRLGLRP